MTEKLPLSGVRVIDLATFIAGPFTAAVLSEFGAEVIKVEQPGLGDPLRKFGSPSQRGDGYAWLSEQRNKKSVTLDLRQPDGAALFKRLVAEADILCENFRPGTMEKWGLGPDALKAVNPGLVMVRISGYGQKGPYKDRPGFARIAHAFGGLTHLTGVPGGPPLTPGSTSLADYISGLYGAVGALMALRTREDVGGQVIDIALYESIFRVLDEMAPLYAATGFVRPRLGLMTSNVCPHGHFECGDGGWVAIACTSDKMWRRMAAVLGREELGEDERYATSAQRVENRDDVEAMVTAFTLSLPREQGGGDLQRGRRADVAGLFHRRHLRGPALPGTRDLEGSDRARERRARPCAERAPRNVRDARADREPGPQARRPQRRGLRRPARPLDGRTRRPAGEGRDLNEGPVPALPDHPARV